MPKTMTKWVGLIGMMAGMLMASGVQAAELEIQAEATDSLTTGVLTVANNAYGEFYVPAGRIVIRAVDDGSSTVTRSFVKFFATNPSSANLDASTRELTGILLQEGDTITITTTRPGWVAVDGLTGTTNLTAHWVR